MIAEKFKLQVSVFKFMLEYFLFLFNAALAPVLLQSGVSNTCVRVQEAHAIHAAL